MKKSRVIATCPTNSGMFSSVEDADQAVRRVFLDEFPASSFADWDGDVDDRTAEHVVRSVGRASWINVKKFIEDLW